MDERKSYHFVNSEVEGSIDKWYITVVADHEELNIQRFQLLDVHPDELILDKMGELCNISPEQAQDFIIRWLPLLVSSAEGYVIETKNGTITKMIDGLSRTRQVVTLGDNMAVRTEEDTSVYGKEGYFLLVNEERIPLKQFFFPSAKDDMSELTETMYETYWNKLSQVVCKLCGEKKEIEHLIAKGRMLGIF